MTALPPRYDDETLSRWADGELSPGQAAEIERAATADAVLANRLAALRRVRAAARAAFPAAADARDADLARLIQAHGAARPSPIAGLGRALADAFAPRRAAVWGGLATAAFVAGLAVAPLLSAGKEGFAVGSDGALRDAALVRVLDARLAAQGADGAGRAVGLTFRDGEGRWCRSFQAADDGVAGLACRDGDEWALRALAPLEAAPGEVRQASSETSPVILAAVDAALAGDVADASVETAARDAGWR